MNRNRNVDILRDGAILVIVLYHAYVLCGTPWTAHTRLHTILSFCGELGVTLFFLLSGFGIYMSLDRKRETKGLPSWKSFMKSRAKRILPQYYFCIMILLIFQSAHLLSADGWKHIAAYVCFVQNLFVDTHGSINGALWTMATIVQYYLIAKWLYLAVQKKPVLSCAASVAISVVSKYIMYTMFIPAFQMEGSAYFVYGRQLPCALDNFVFGMAAAALVKSEWFAKRSKGCLYAAGSVLTAGSAVGLIAAAFVLSQRGIYGNSMTGLLGHTVLAVLFLILIVGISMLPQIQGIPAKAVQFLAKYQYGIYLWHMPMIISLYQSSPFFQYLAQHSFSLFATGLIIVIIGVGYITSKAVDAAFG